MFTFDVKEHKTLYCLAVYTKDTGSTKANYELELLKMVHKNKASLFAYDGWAVNGEVGDDFDSFPVQKVEDVGKDFHFAKRKHMGTWINIGLHKQV